MMKEFSADTKEKRLVWFTAFSFLFIWADILLGLISAGLGHPAMWTPLILLPVISLSAFIYSFNMCALTNKIFKIFCIVAIVLGGLGVYFHFLHLAKDLNGSIQWEIVARLVRYPPLLAPLTISGIGVLG